jgi:hypothetical protein
MLSTFDSTNEDWTGVRFPVALGDPPTVQQNFNLIHLSGGNPPDSVAINDNNTRWAWFSAPAAWLGDKSAYYGGTLSFDLRGHKNGSLTLPAVMLVGDGKTLFAYGSPLTIAWKNYSYALDPTAWKIGNPLTSNTAPTVSEFQSVLANLTGIYINGEWFTTREYTKMDNVMLKSPTSQAPEPTSLALMLGGVVALTGYAIRRKQTSPA